MTQSLGTATRRGGVVSKELTLDPAKCVVTSIITTQNRDRSGDIVVTAGIDTTNHQRSPVVLLEHNVASPLGLAMSPDGQYGVELRDGYAVATTWFDQKSPMAMQAFRLIDDGIMRATSIGFVAKRARLLDAEGNVDLSFAASGERIAVVQFGVVFDEVELVEYSHLILGDNADALTVLVQKSRVGSEPLAPALKAMLAPYLIETTATTVAVTDAPPVETPTVETKAMAEEKEYAEMDQAPAEETPPADEAAPADAGDDMPPGARALDGLYQRLLEATQFVADEFSSKRQENPEILSYADGLVPQLDELCAAVVDLHDTLYPDLDSLAKGADADAEPVEGDEEADAAAQGKRLRHLMTKRIEAYRKSRVSILAGAKDTSVDERIAEQDAIIAALTKRLDAAEAAHARLMKSFKAARRGQ